jgi:hypothetical protein
MCEVCGSCFVFKSYALAFALQLKKCMEMPVGMIQRVRMAILRAIRTDLGFVVLKVMGKTHGQRRCLPSSSTNGFPNSANLELNVSEI